MEAILSPFQREGISLCLLEMDKDYHRSVVTIIGEIDVVV
jgi:glutamate formiminotransferase